MTKRALLIVPAVLRGGNQSGGAPLLGGVFPRESGEKNKKRRRRQSLAFLSALSILLCAFSARAKLVEKTAVQAGNRMLSLLDVRDFRRQLQAGLVPDTLLFKVFPKKQILREEKPLLEFLAFREALLQMAGEKDFEPSQKQIRGVLASLKGRLSPKAFDKKLQRHGFLPIAKDIPSGKREKPLPEESLEPKSLIEEIAAALKIEFLLTQEVASKIIVSDNDVNAYYLKKTGRDMFRNFEYDLISVSFPAGKEGRRQAKAFQEAMARSSFEEAAKQSRQELKSSRLKDSEMNPAMRQALKRLSVSQVSDLVTLGGQTYIFQLKWKSPILSSSEEREKARIQALLFELELKKNLRKWLDQKQAAFSLKIQEA